MHALAQLVPLLLVLFCVFARGNLRKLFILGAIITLPLRITYAVGTSSHAGWVDGVTISLSEVFFLLFAVNTLLRGDVRPDHVSADRIARGLVLFAAACLVSMVNTTSKPLTLWLVIMLTQVLLLNYRCMVRCVNDRDDLNAALLGITLSVIFQGVIACVQFARQDNFLLYSTGGNLGQTISVSDFESGAANIRVFGTVGKPNGYAMVLAPLLLINIALLPVKEVAGRALRMLSIPLGFLGLIFSGSRGAWLSCSVALLAYIVFAIWSLKERRLQAIGGVVLFLTVALIAGGPFIMQRLTSDDGNAAGSRIPIIGIAVEMIKAHSIVGVGANTYPNVMRRYLPVDYEASYVGQVHNMYLLVLAEMGLIGFAAAFYLVRSMLMEALSSFRNVDSRLQMALGLGLILVLIQVSVHSMVEAYISKMAIGSLFTVTGIVLAARRIDV